MSTQQGPVVPFDQLDEIQGSHGQSSVCNMTPTHEQYGIIDLLNDRRTSLDAS